MKPEHPVCDIDALRGMGERLLKLRVEDLPRSDLKVLILEFLNSATKPWPLINIYRLNTWYRARIQRPTDKVNDHLKDLIYRQELPFDFGRAHSPGNRTFYAGWNVTTALAETNAQPGDVAWIVHSRLRKGVEVPALAFGAFEQFYRSGRLPYPASGLTKFFKDLFQTTNPEYLVRTAYVDSVLSILLREQGSAKYFLTSLLAEMTTLAPQSSAFLYPSVQASHSFNIAVSDKTFDECFEVMAVEKYFVADTLGPGLCLFSGVHRSHDFSKDGNINWFSQHRHRCTRSAEDGLQYSDEAIGWTVPTSWKTANGSASAA